MNKQEIVDQLSVTYGDFIDLINELCLEKLNFRFKEKWSAKQQLEHIVLCVEPLVKVFGMPKTMLEQHFGKVDRPVLSYQEHLDVYLQKLKTGGKAPTQYIPQEGIVMQKETLVDTLRLLITELSQKVQGFEEIDLETLAIPHPLLGKITLKEMLYNAIYHVQYHKMQVLEHLELM